MYYIYDRLTGEIIAQSDEREALRDQYEEMEGAAFQEAPKRLGWMRCEPEELADRLAKGLEAYLTQKAYADSLPPVIRNNIATQEQWDAATADLPEAHRWEIANLAAHGWATQATEDGVLLTGHDTQTSILFRKTGERERVPSGQQCSNCGFNDLISGGPKRAIGCRLPYKAGQPASFIRATMPSDHCAGWKKERWNRA